MQYVDLGAFVGLLVAMVISGGLYRQHILRKITGFGTSTMAICVMISTVHLVQMLIQLDDPSQIGPPLAHGILTTFYGAIVLFACHVVQAAGLGYSKAETPPEDG